MPIEIDDFPELAAARKLWHDGRVTKANEAYALAVKLKPNNVRAKVEFSKALGQQHQILAAEQLLLQAEENSVGQPKALIVIAQAFRSIYRQERALAIFEALRQQAQLPAAILGELAVLYEQFGRYEDALGAIQECLTVASDRPEPKLIHARLLRHRTQLDTAAGILQALRDLPRPSPALQIEVFTELCYLHDAMGEYDSAVKSIEQAKALLRGTPIAKRLKRQSEHLNRSFSQLYDEIDEATIRRWVNASIECKAEVAGVAHILGFPRTGTTLLEQALDAHPKITCAPERVVFSKHIFPGLTPTGEEATAAAIDGASDAKLTALAKDYFRCHEEIRGKPYCDEWLVDKNPNHTSLLAGILRILPSSKFITVQRDPRDVLVSCYLRTFPLSEYSVAFLDWQSTWELYQHEQRILDRVKSFLEDRFIEIRYEDMVQDLAGEYGRVVDFLNLERTSTTVDHQAVTEAKIVNSPTHAEVRRPVTSSRVGRWENYREHLATIDGLEEEVG